MTLRFHWLTRQIADMDREYKQMIKIHDLIINSVLTTTTKEGNIIT